MAGGIFVDTSAWYALADKVDVNHGLATEFFPRAMAEYREIVSTNHVIGETYTLIVSRLGRDAAWLFCGIFGSPGGSSVYLCQKNRRRRRMVSWSAILTRTSALLMARLSWL